MDTPHPGPRVPAHSSAASTGVWVGVGAITMSFAAYTSALIVRQGASGDWLHFQLPWILFLNTALIIASSVTLEVARRNNSPGRLDPKSGVLLLPGPTSRTVAWLNATLALGALFVIGQVVAWRQLAHQGLYLSTNPSSAFFYILTALHALHLLGGLCGLVYVRRRLGIETAVRAAAPLGAASLYWHFMAVLWVYVLLLLVVRL
jgi:cytochrome c oxidase subunit III